MSADEHPSGLRDAIEIDERASLHATIDAALVEYEDEVSFDPEVVTYTRGFYVERAVRAWLSVVSEGEIEAADELVQSVRRMVEDGHPDDREWFRIMCERLRAVEDAAASRGVLLPKETSGSSYSAGSLSMKEHP